MGRSLIDSNIVIDALNGRQQAITFLRSEPDRAISVITWIEVMSGARPEDEDATRDFLDAFELAPLDQAVAEEAARLRRQGRLKLPDAVILASARLTGRMLMTRNVLDFPPDGLTIREPYRL